MTTTTTTTTATMTTTTMTEAAECELFARLSLKLIREAVLIKGEIETLRTMLAKAEARSAQLDQAVIDLGLTEYVDRYQSHINKQHD